VKRGEGLLATASRQHSQYSSLVTNLKENFDKRKRPSRPETYDMIKQAKEVGNSKPSSRLQQLMPSSKSADTIPTVRVIEQLHTKENEDSRELIDTMPAGIAQIHKLANLQQFFIVRDIQKKYHSVTKVLRENELKQAIEMSIERFVKRINRINCVGQRENEMGNGNVNRQKVETAQMFMTMSEKKLQRLDAEIQKEIEEVIANERRKGKIEIQKAEANSSSTRNKKHTAESKIKAVRRVDPEYIGYSKAQAKGKNENKEISRSFISNFRSVSTFHLSPSESRMSTYKKKAQKESAWMKNIRKMPKNKGEAVTMFMDELNDYSAIAKEFVKNTTQMESSLRKAFHTRVGVKPAALFKSINSHKTLIKP
jgi:hypothetical protein